MCTARPLPDTLTDYLPSDQRHPPPLSHSPVHLSTLRNVVGSISLVCLGHRAPTSDARCPSENNKADRFFKPRYYLDLDCFKARDRLTWRLTIPGCRSGLSVTCQRSFVSDELSFLPARLIQGTGYHGVQIRMRPSSRSQPCHVL